MACDKCGHDKRTFCGLLPEHWYGISQGLAFRRRRSGFWYTVQALLTLLLKEAPIGLPVTVFGDGAQTQQIFDASLGSAHA